MKMCNVWHSWNESPIRRGSGYHRAPLGPASVCLTLIMAHANERAALKSGGLPDSVEGFCVSVACSCALHECVSLFAYMSNCQANPLLPFHSHHSLDTYTDPFFYSLV